ncbi:polysaccharide biosynthesis tyrosine autokinase [Pluralibacter gergoviae]|nr:polysaccharide biosynthesis tyrosine autokinase [Pluralibacter gergoviae]EMD1656849.1 polysaccharide biosynthesis tyrosine autokinase [Pluralibacter gergoviae]
MPPVISSKVESQDSDDIDLKRIVGEFLDHYKLIVSILAIFLAISINYVIFATPIYQSDAMIQVEQKQGNALLDNLSQMLPDGQPQSAPEIALLQSRMILGKTVDDLQLQTKVERNYFPVFGRGWNRLLKNKPQNINVSRLYIDDNENNTNSFELEVLDDNKYHIIGENFDVNGTVGKMLNQNGISLMVSDIKAEPGTTFTITYLTRLRAINDLQQALTVLDSGKDTGILNLTLIGEDPVQISKVLNYISQTYLKQNIERQAAQDAKSLDFLNQQLPKVRSELDLAEDKLNSYRRKKDSVDLTLEAKSVLDQIVNVDNQLNELTIREAEISQLYTKEHPSYKSLMEKRQTLLKEKNKLNKKVSGMPATQQEVLRLSRDVESGRAVYMQLLNRQQELNIAKSSAIGNVRIIDSAVTLPRPVSPKVLLALALGLFFGLIISSLIVLVKIFLRQGIESPEQLEEIGVNVYASIPVSESLTKRQKMKGLRQSKRSIEYGGFLAVDDPTDLSIEAIRGLRTSLHFAMMEARNKVLMISGASPNAGKTFVSSNLSAVIAQTGQKVLYIDADMRKGYAYNLFKVTNDNGLSDILSGKISPPDAIKPVPTAGFDSISRGTLPPNPAELLMNHRFESLINWANEHYDLIILDTPPILAVTDAAIIGRYAGTVLLVARFEENSIKEIEVSVKRFEQSGVSVKGCILNGIVKKASSYYSYGYHHYGYSYDEK